MKMKRILALLLAVILVTGATSSVFAANTSDKEYVNQQQIAFLTKMGFMINDTEEDFGTERYVSRGEFADILVGMLNLNMEELSEDTAICADVTGRYKYAESVKLALDSGYMTTDDEGKFWPNEIITLEEVSYSFVVLAGGKVHLQNNAAITVAKKLKLYTESGAAARKMTKGQIAALLYDTLHAEFYNQILYGTESVYQKRDDYLVLEERFGIKYAKGIVSAANRSGLTKVNEEAVDDIILIDGAYYKGVVDANQHFGYAVEYYYAAKDQKEKNRQLLYIRRSEKNQVLEIDAKLVGNVSNGVVSYYQNEKSNKAKTFKVTKKTDVIYNGMAYPAWTDADLNPGFGKVTAIDNNNDNVYDVVHVENYKFFVVGYVDGNKLLLYDKYNNEMLDLSEIGTKYTICRENGDPVSLSRGARNGGMLVIKESKKLSGLRNIEITVAGMPVTEEVSKIFSEGIVIGETTAKFSKALTGTVDKKELLIGSKVSAYIWKDEIVRLEEPGAETELPNLVYLVHAAVDKEPFSGTLKLRWCNDIANFCEAEGAKKINVDGKNYKDMNKVLEILNMASRNSNYSEDHPYAQPIQIYTDEEGKVVKIDTLLFDETSEDKATSLQKGKALQSAKYSSYNQSYYVGTELHASIKPSTVFYLIPNDRSDDGAYYKHDGRMWKSNGGVEDIETFFVNESNQVTGAIFIYFNPETTVSGYATPGIVTEIGSTLTEEGDVVKQLTYYNLSGQLETLTISADYEAPEIRIGDVIRWRQDNKGKMIDFDITFSPYKTPIAEDRIHIYTANGTIDTGTRQLGYSDVFGTVLEFQDSFLTVTTSIPSDVTGVEAKANLDNYTAGSASCYRLERIRNANVVTPISTSQLIPYSTDSDEASVVYMFMTDSSLRMVYEIRL